MNRLTILGDSNANLMIYLVVANGHADRVTQM